MSRNVVLLLVSLAVSVLPFTYAFGDFVECSMTASSPEGVLFVCPQGDGDRLDTKGLTVTVTVNYPGAVPLPDVSTDYIWLEACSGLLAACGDGAKIHASAPTNANGQTTITGRFAAGGCDNTGVQVFVNIPTEGPMPGAIICESACLPIAVRSCDLDGNLVVNLIDFSTFGQGYQSPPKAYNACLDFAAPFGTVTLADYAKYGTHSSHHC